MVVVPGPILDPVAARLTAFRHSFGKSKEIQGVGVFSRADNHNTKNAGLGICATHQMR
jgi:hypothetical protein